MCKTGGRKMPLMLEEDYQISLPSMHRVRQKFDRPRVEDPEGRIRSEFAKEEISGKYEKGSVWQLPWEAAESGIWLSLYIALSVR